LRKKAEKSCEEGVDIGSGLEFTGLAEKIGGEVGGIGFLVAKRGVAEAQAGINVEDGELAIASFADAVAAVRPGGGSAGPGVALRFVTGVSVGFASAGRWEYGRVR